MLHLNKDIVKFLILSGILSCFYLVAQIFLTTVKQGNKDIESLKKLFAFSLIITFIGLLYWIWPYVAAYPAEAVSLLLLSLMTGYVAYKITYKQVRRAIIVYANGLYEGQLLQADNLIYKVKKIGDESVLLLAPDLAEVQVTFDEFASRFFKSVQKVTFLGLENFCNVEQVKELLSQSEIYPYEKIGIFMDDYSGSCVTKLVFKEPVDFELYSRLYKFLKQNL